MSRVYCLSGNPSPPGSLSVIFHHLRQMSAPPWQIKWNCYELGNCTASETSRTCSLLLNTLWLVICPPPVSAKVRGCLHVGKYTDWMCLDWNVPTSSASQVPSLVVVRGNLPQLLCTQPPVWEQWHLEKTFRKVRIPSSKYLSHLTLLLDIFSKAQ